MIKRLLAPFAVFMAIAAFGIYGLSLSKAQEPIRSAREAAARPASGQLTIDHSDCTFFGPARERFTSRLRPEAGFTAGRATQQFSAIVNRGSGAGIARSRPFTAALAGDASANLIDQYINADLQAHGITPADKTTDYEFIRRATLDITGRIPVASRVGQFVGSADPAKRAALIDELLARPEWVDKWTMFFGDLYKNTAASVQVRIQVEGRNAFYKYIHDSLAAGKPYDQMASEIIAAQGSNNFDQSNGQVNFLTLGVVTGGPSQDIFDQQAANVAETFLGMAHMNCLLCHNGRGHLDSLSLWGSQTTRTQAWGLAAFMSHTWTRALVLPKDPNTPNAANYNYWSLDKYTTDYSLNTTTGNRPARQPVGTVRTMTPVYPFTGATPDKGEDYRAALARMVTGDFQFARATVNYIWAQFFGVGIVDPPDQFDPARQDPDNPPPAPWTLQASNPQLLNALTYRFIRSGYDLKGMMRLIANSDTYQLASEYSGDWDPSWDKYFGRKFVRRLWSEEVHDSAITALGVLPSYTVGGFSNDSAIYGANSPGFGKISFAMQAPEVVNMPDGGGAVSQFLDTFLRGNRDDQPRKGEGSILQALGLMNDNFIESRIHATGAGATATYLQNQLSQTDSQLVNTLFVAVLSRPATPAEMTLAAAQLAKGGAAARKTNAEDLLWALFNKLDFVFNY